MEGMIEEIRKIHAKPWINTIVDSSRRKSNSREGRTPLRYATVVLTAVAVNS